jgi:hypothetical protein
MQEGGGGTERTTRAMTCDPEWGIDFEGAEEVVEAANARFGLRKDVERAWIQLWAHHWGERKGFDGVAEALGMAFVGVTEGGWREFVRYRRRIGDREKAGRGSTERPTPEFCTTHFDPPTTFELRYHTDRPKTRIRNKARDCWRDWCSGVGWGSCD